MKKLDVSAVTSSIGLPVKSGSLSHVQAAYQEALGELAKAIAGTGYDPTKVYILNGCANTGSGSNYVISAGSVFFNGEVYLVDATSFTISGPNVAVGLRTLTFFTAANADPVQFTDGITRTIHQIWKIVPQSGLSGSGAGNYLDWVQLNLNIPTIDLTGTGQANITGTYPNINVDVPVVALEVLAKGITPVGDVPTGGVAVPINFSSSVPTSAYTVVGGVKSNSSNHLSDSAVSWCWYNPTTAGFTAFISETVGATQDVSISWAAIKL